MKKKYFVSCIHGYFYNLRYLSPEENYHLHALMVAKEMGYVPVAIVKGGEKDMRTDPNYDPDIRIIPYTNIFYFLYQVIAYTLRGSIFYVNSYEWQSFVVPFISRHAIFMAHTQPKRKSKIKQIIHDFVYHFFWRIRLNNETEKEFLIGQGIAVKKMFIVPLVVAENYFYKTNTSERRDVVYFGNVTAKKNLPTILRAIDIVRNTKPDIRLHVVGKIADAAFQKTIDELRLQNYIVIHGFTSLEKLADTLNQYMIYVNASFDEGQCVAVYDSALCGCALCLPNIMSFVGVFKDKALFHDVMDHAQLAKNILAYLDNPAKIQKDNSACIEMIRKEYTKEIIEQKMKKLFTSDK
jgi:glycosyltransferase involved in cell wall biosynthesis